MLQTIPILDHPNAQQTAITATYPYYESPPMAVIVWGPHVMDGTGATCTLEAYRDRAGYRPFGIIEQVPELPPVAQPFAELMLEIKGGFGRTLSRLPVVFGVSRQTLYNWLAGETPKDAHQATLIELAAAAREFSAVGFRPTAAMLGRTVAKGKSFLGLLAEGEDGAAAAKSLMRIVERSLRTRSRLDAALSGREKGLLTAEDVGAPAIDEGA
jgi:hypothetical protein